MSWALGPALAGAGSALRLRKSWGVTPALHEQSVFERAAGAVVVVGSLPDAAAHAGAVWIDALFGTGLDRPLTGTARAWVEAFDRARGHKLAVDIPSGLHGDTGDVLGAAVHADVTVTFAAKKRGMVTATGAAHCGRIVVAGLGLP